MEKSCTTRAALALARDRRQNCLRTCAVTRVAAATTRGLGLVEDIWYYHHFGVCKIFVAATAIVYTKNLTSREVKARNSLHLLTKKFFAFESVSAHDLI